MSQSVCFDVSAVKWSKGWKWDNREYWGEAGEIVGILPNSMVLETKFEKRSTEQCFIHATISRAIGVNLFKSGETNCTSELEKWCNQQATELLKDSVENGTPIKMLISKYELLEDYPRPELSNLKVVEYL